MAFDVQGYLRSLKRFGMKPGLERIHAILGRLGNPEAAFPAVHIGGTNGKGSVAATTASILRAAGYRVGMFTSPHLIHYHERIRVDGQPIPDEALQRIFAQVAGRGRRRPRRSWGPTLPSLKWALRRFLHVSPGGRRRPRGGRGGAGRPPGLHQRRPDPSRGDHAHQLRPHAVLGSTLPSIAREKAGILRPGMPGRDRTPASRSRGSVPAEAARRFLVPWYG